MEGRRDDYGRGRTSRFGRDGRYEEQRRGDRNGNQAECNLRTAHTQITVAPTVEVVAKALPAGLLKATHQHQCATGRGGSPLVLTDEGLLVASAEAEREVAPRDIEAIGSLLVHLTNAVITPKAKHVSEFFKQPAIQKPSAKANELLRNLHQRRSAFTEFFLLQPNALKEAVRVLESTSASDDDLSIFVEEYVAFGLDPLEGYDLGALLVGTNSIRNGNVTEELNRDLIGKGNTAKLNFRKLREGARREFQHIVSSFQFLHLQLENLETMRGEMRSAEFQGCDEIEAAIAECNALIGLKGENATGEGRRFELSISDVKTELGLLTSLIEMADATNVEQRAELRRKVLDIRELCNARQC